MSRVPALGHLAAAPIRVLVMAALPLVVGGQGTPSRTDRAVSGRPIVTAVRQGRAIAITHAGTFAVLGVGSGRTIYRTSAGMLFRLDPKTGAVTTVAANTRYIRITSGVEQVTILEIDAKGDVLQKNTQGVAFHLNRKTGAPVFVKWPK